MACACSEKPAFILHVCEGCPCSAKAQIAAKYSGVDCKIVPLAEDAKARLSPTGGCGPILEATCCKAIYEPNTVARYLAALRPDAGLLGNGFKESMCVEQWIEFATSEIEPHADNWILPILGFQEYNHPLYTKAKEEVSRLLKVVDDHLLYRSFLVGDHITLADIQLVCVLFNVFKMVMEPAVRNTFVNVMRWFDTCIHQPHFAAVLGEITYCEKEQRAEKKKGGKPEKKEGEQEEKKEKEGKKGKKQQKKEEKEETPAPAAAAAAGAAAAGAPAGDEDDEDAPKPKPKKNLNEEEKWAIKPSPMDLDNVKRLFSNNPVSVALEQFWREFDHDTYCMYEAEYKYNSDNTIFFMTCNLVNGFMQRLEEARKVAFGSITVCGAAEDQAPYTVRCCFLFKWREIPTPVRECPDFDSYDWKPIDVKTPEGRARVEEYFSNPTPLPGLKVLERRLFK